MATAEIVAIGSELLLGQIVDTNSAWMAQRLTALGVNLYFKSVVGDNPGRMKEVIARALERADIVITSGGVGPTQDDLTREIVAEVAGENGVHVRSNPAELREVLTNLVYNAVHAMPAGFRVADANGVWLAFCYGDAA